MKKRVMMGVLGVIATLVVATRMPVAKTYDTQSLVVADADNIVFALVYLADALGYFREEGVAVSYRKFNSGKAALNDVLQGHADIAMAFQTPVVSAVLEGRPVRVVSMLHRSNAAIALVARRDRGISRFAHLAGKRVGVPEGTYVASLLNQVVEDDGVPHGQVQHVPMSFPETPGALAGGSVDAVMTRWPYVGEARDLLPAGDAVILTAPAYSEVSMLAAMNHTLQEKREAMSRFMRALVRAEDFLIKKRDVAFDLVEHRWPLVQQRESDLLLWRTSHFELGLDNTLLEALRAEAAWMREGKSGRVIDFQRVVDGSLLDPVRPHYVLVRGAP